MDVRVLLAGIIFVFPCFCRTGQGSGGQFSGYLHLKNTTRVKRVFFGVPLLDEKSYDVMRYIIFITNGQCGSNFWSRLKHRVYGLCDPPNVNWLQCGGSLISEYTVQTACHCIVHWTLLNDTHFKGNPRTVWEDQFVMYAGNFDVAQMKDGSRAIMFILHQKCVKVRSDAFSKGLPGEGGHITYDFGIIFGRTPLIRKYNFVLEAPTYAVSELRRLYEKIQYDESVCLLVGWGHAKVVEDPKKLYKKGLAIFSQYLQHAWNRVMSYCDCAASHPSLNAFLERTGLGRQDQKYSYKEFASWFCVTKFGKMTGVSGPGDSGSPVTCDNIYMGLISKGHLPRWGKKERWPGIRGAHSAVKFTEKENAAEFRRAFLAQLQQSVLKIAKREFDAPQNWQKREWEWLGRKSDSRVLFIQIPWLIIIHILPCFSSFVTHLQYVLEVSQLVPCHSTGCTGPSKLAYVKGSMFFEVLCCEPSREYGLFTGTRR